MAKQLQPIRRKVAMKIIKVGMDAGQIVARFEAERQALPMMNHPNIAKVLSNYSLVSVKPSTMPINSESFTGISNTC